MGIQARARSSCGRSSSTTLEEPPGKCGSRPIAVSATGTPSTSSTRSRTTRRCAGRAGHRTPLAVPVARMSASTSEPIGPRSVESIFLNHCRARPPVPTVVSRSAASAAVSVRLSVSTTVTALAGGRRGHTLTGTAARAVNSAPVSHAPVRSSATMVRGLLRVGFIGGGSI